MAKITEPPANKTESRVYGYIQMLPYLEQRALRRYVLRRYHDISKRLKTASIVISWEEYQFSFMNQEELNAFLKFIII